MEINKERQGPQPKGLPPVAREKSYQKTCNIEEVKRSVDIVKIIESKDIQLKKKGKNLVALCPFHKEKTPSFTVDPVKQLYNCFGCDSGGDVIGFIVKHDSISFKEAVKRLSVNGYQLSGKSRKTEGRRQKAEENPQSEIQNPKSITPKQQKLLNRVIQYYQGSLIKEPVGLNYLQKERGISDKQSVIDFKAGYASGKLLEVIPSDGEIIEDLKTIGILNNKGNELFYRCVLFPLLDENNNTLSLYGRRIEKEGEIKHLYLPGPKKGIINRQAAKRSKSLIITESVIDALSLYNAGFKNIIPCYGTNGLTKDILSLFSRYNTEEIYICFDSDPSGKQAAKEIATQLKEKGITTYIIDLPEKDVNDYFTRHAPEEFEKLIKRANPQSLQRSERVQKREETFTPTDYGFIVGYGNRLYEIKGISRQGTQLKATIKANLNGVKDARFELSTIDLYSNRSREWFARLCVGILGEQEELLKEDLNRLLEKVDTYQKPSSDKKKKKELTDAEKKEAITFLRNPNLFEEILKDLETTGYTGEDVNKLLCYLAAVSRKLDDPISILIQSRSAAGKSSLQNAILSLIPDEDYSQYTRITDQALFYKEENSLVHKTLAIEEAEGMGGAAYSIRNIQSSKSLTIACTGKDPVTGRQQTEEHKVKGPVMVMLTTTRPEIDEETASRFICITIDETKEMTERIHKMQREGETLEGLLKKKKTERIIRKHQNAQRILKPLHVVNPYSQYLSFPAHSLRTRRDHKKYLSLIKAITFIHQYQRKKKSLNYDGDIIDYIEVTLKDIELANKIANDLLGQSLDEISRPSRNLLTLVHKMVKEKANGHKDYSFRRREIREYTGWSDWQVKAYIKELEEMEYLYSRMGSKGKEYIYELNYNGQGKNGKRFYLGLTEVKSIRKTLKNKHLGGR